MTTPIEDIDFEALHENFINGNRRDVGVTIAESDNPAWTALRLLREFIFYDGVDNPLIDNVVSLQLLTERYCMVASDD